ncbi:MAG: helix-turn-helix transcriptional regulator [Blautia sp.]|nr:helix-turn-helix transcriptional regulator [Blautia sp.]
MLGTRIKEVRISSNLSQVQFAEKLGVKKQSVSNWENENVQPSVDMLRRIAVYYSCSTDFLLELDTSRIIVDVTGLTLAQRAHIQQLIDDLRYLNKEQAYRKQANKETE